MFLISQHYCYAALGTIFHLNMLNFRLHVKRSPKCMLSLEKQYARWCFFQRLSIIDCYYITDTTASRTPKGFTAFFRTPQCKDVDL